MGVRKYVEASVRHPARFEIDGEWFTPDNCEAVAHVDNPAANILDAVLKTDDNRFFRLTSVLDGAVEGHADVRTSWYVATFISEAEASLLRESWAVLRDQPHPADYRPLTGSE